MDGDYKERINENKMAEKMIYIAIVATLLVHVVISNDSDPIPADKNQINKWFQNNVQPLNLRKSTLDPGLMTAEENIKVIKVSQDGKGDFKSITEAVTSIPIQNTQRIIVAISGGTYKEKINVNQSYITFYGSPTSMPTLVFDGISSKYGNYYCGTVTVNGDYFVAANIIFKNSVPRPHQNTNSEQGLAIGVLGNKASFYNSKFIGFQDTLLSEGKPQFYKDCYVEGTVDFIFGRGKTIFLNTELHVIPGNVGNPSNVITSQSRPSSSSDEGYSFVHCSVTGTGGDTVLGRALFAYATVIYSYTEISNVINPQGWWDNDEPAFDKTVFFREYKNTGPGAAPPGRTGRVPYSKELSDNEATQFLTLGYIQGSKWLLPPPSL